MTRVMLDDDGDARNENISCRSFYSLVRSHPTLLYDLELVEILFLHFFTSLRTSPGIRNRKEGAESRTSNLALCSVNVTKPLVRCRRTYDVHTCSYASLTTKPFTARRANDNHRRDGGRLLAQTALTVASAMAPSRAGLSASQ